LRRAEEARAHGLARRRALCVAAPRARDYEQAAQSAGSQERTVDEVVSIAAKEAGDLDKPKVGGNNARIVAIAAVDDVNAVSAMNDVAVSEFLVAALRWRFRPRCFGSVQWALFSPR
jgi:hypothetical protein